MATYVRTNRVKEKLAAGTPVLGIEVWLRDPRVVELVGAAGFDFVHIENEHVARDWSEIENFVRAAELCGLTPLFRCEQTVDGMPPANQILKALKCGVQVLMVPQVETVETAKRLVDIVKYPPKGRHGFAPVERSAKEIQVGPIDVRRFVDEAMAEVMTWVIIESPLGVENVDAILDVDGIDAVGFGPGDFAVTAGLSSTSDPLVQAAREHVQAAAQGAGKYYWWTTDDPSTIPAMRAAGVRIALVAGEIVHLNSLLRRCVAVANGEQPSGQA
jgi:4-hydroxy-2-oxoheptanedioate aldolase